MTLSPYAAPGIPQARNISMSLIEKYVCAAFDQSVKQVHSKSRKAELVMCRQLTMLLGRELLHLGYRDIGEFYATDHATAMHSVQRAQDRMDTESDIAENVNELKGKILFGL